VATTDVLIARQKSVRAPDHAVVAALRTGARRGYCPWLEAANNRCPVLVSITAVAFPLGVPFESLDLPDELGSARGEKGIKDFVH
jgi:hypothetical protein